MTEEETIVNDDEGRTILSEQEHASEDEIRRVEQELDEDRQSHADDEEIQDVEADLEEP
jgi:hypothetical protein